MSKIVVLNVWKIFNGLREEVNTKLQTWVMEPKMITFEWNTTQNSLIELKSASKIEKNVKEKKGKSICNKIGLQKSITVFW